MCGEGSKQLNNAYFYAFYSEKEQRAYSGIAAGSCEGEIRECIASSFGDAVRYVTIRRIPELLGVCDFRRGEAEIMRRRDALAITRFGLYKEEREDAED